MTDTVMAGRPLVITFSDGADPISCKNHGIYAAMMGYGHEVRQLPRTPDALVRVLFKYHTIAALLDEATDGRCFLFLEGTIAFGSRLDFPSLLGDCGTLVFRDVQEDILGALIAMRASPHTRRLATQLLDASGRAFAASSVTETAVWGQLRPSEVPTSTVRGMRLLAFGVSDCDWLDEPVWAVSFSPAKIGRAATPVIFGSYYDRRLVDIVIDAISHSLCASRSVSQLMFTPPPAPATVKREARVGFVSLGHNVAYAGYSHDNFARYCATHGYALHFYTEIPTELNNDGVSAPWLKIEILKRHIASHEFLVWLDADMLFHDFRVSFESLINGRDRIFARDIGDWKINAGVLGFRNTAQNRALLETLALRLGEVDDRSSVYASQGDQAHTIDVLLEHGLLDNVLSGTALNTHPLLYTPHAWLVHYMGYVEPLRTLYMAHDAKMIQHTQRGDASDQDPE